MSTDPTEASDTDASTGDPTEEPRETVTGFVTSGPLPDTSTGDLTIGDTTEAGTTDSETTGPVVLCGNGMIDLNEECDGNNLAGADCPSLGFTGGTLQCGADCLFDKSMCTSPSCGDGNVDAAEECDCGNQGANCTMAQLGNTGCINLVSPNGGNYSGGTLACNSPQSCSFNKAGCFYCGDGVRNALEDCDGADLGGQTCAGLGFTGGNLSCSAQCTYNTGACTSCGNNIIDAGEICDGNNLGGQTCASQNPNVFGGGTLTCQAGCNGFSTAGCNSGNCCIAGGGAGACSVIPIRNCVCGADPFCCNTNWDQLCVNRAIAQCGAQC